MALHKVAKFVFRRKDGKYLQKVHFTQHQNMRYPPKGFDVCDDRENARRYAYSTGCAFLNWFSKFNRQDGWQLEKEYVEVEF